MTELVFHIGYPKTATTALQTAFFPNHEEIDYQGKLLPSHRYRDPELFDLVYAFQTQSTLEWHGQNAIQAKIRDIVARSSQRVVVFSSENFLHPETVDIGVVAERFARVFPEARFIITLREQSDLLHSFYRNHGAFGQYLFVMKELFSPLQLPLSLEEWLEYQFRTPWKNVLGTLDYGAVVESYVARFGRGNVMVGLFEMLRRDEAQFRHTLCDFLGVKLPSAGSAGMGQHNAGLTGASLAAAFGRLRAGRRLQASSNQSAVKGGASEHDRMMPEPWLSMVRDRFRTGNRWLTEMMGLPLEEHGYAI